MDKHVAEDFAEAMNSVATNAGPVSVPVNMKAPKKKPVLSKPTKKTFSQNKEGDNNQKDSTANPGGPGPYKLKTKSTPQYQDTSNAR